MKYSINKEHNELWDKMGEHGWIGETMKTIMKIWNIRKIQNNVMIRRKMKPIWKQPDNMTVRGSRRKYEKHLTQHETNQEIRTNTHTIRLCKNEFLPPAKGNAGKSFAKDPLPSTFGRGQTNGRTDGQTGRHREETGREADRIRRLRIPVHKDFPAFESLT